MQWNFVTDTCYNRKVNCGCIQVSTIVLIRGYVNAYAYLLFSPKTYCRLVVYSRWVTLTARSPPASWQHLKPKPAQASSRCYLSSRRVVSAYYNVIAASLFPYYTLSTSAFVNLSEIKKRADSCYRRSSVASGSSSHGCISLQCASKAPQWFEVAKICQVHRYQ